MDFMKAIRAMTGDIIKYHADVLCKDELILSCNISCVNDIIVEDIIQHKKTFINSVNITQILNKRCSIINRYGLLDCLKELGLSSKLDLLRITHGVSLTDCLWVKFRGEDLKWKNVCPYGQKHSFDINWFLDKSNPYLKNVLPNYSTDGQFAKCWMSDAFGNYLVKTGTSGAYNAGLEPLSETLFTQIASSIGYVNHVKYEPYFIDYTGTGYQYKQTGILQKVIGPCSKRLATKCDAFTDEDASLVTAAELGLSSYEDCIEFAKELVPNSFELEYMLLCDCIGFNTDRHMGNIGFVYYSNNMHIYEVAPMYDNNLSLLCYWDERDDIYEYAKTRKAHDGSEFVELAGKLLSKSNHLFEILKTIDIQLSSNMIVDDRLDILNKVIKDNIKSILKGE